ncbi:MAG: rod shape-determining protein MreC [Bacteroidales bacterium]|nr:rod shape-determining protein MreC [Bacteroidales bacterium]
MRQSKLLPRILSVAVFILLEIASLYLLSRNSEVQHSFLSRGSHAVMGAVWGRTQAIKEYFSLAGRNRDLAQENFELQRRLLRAQEQLRMARIDTASTAGRDGFSVQWAEVVRSSRNKQHNYFILNRGYEDGIQEKSGVITPDGVVGMIEGVSARHSFAYSFQNADISISARLGTEGGTGILVWDGKSRRGALLKEIPLQYKYDPGDTVYTSGHSLLFPPDIPLGVAGDARMVNGTTNEIKVTLFQDFSAVRYVSVVHNNAFDEIQEFQQ